MKCDKCDGTGVINICIKCKKVIELTEPLLRIETDKGRIAFGPFCEICLGMSLAEIKLICNNFVDPVLDDLRTRPTEPPDPPKRGDFPNPRCEKKLQNGPESYVQCDLHLGHKGNHSHQYNSDHRYTWEENVSS
jgi:hypothetical protein